MDLPSTDGDDRVDARRGGESRPPREDHSRHAPRERHEGGGSPRAAHRGRLGETSEPRRSSLIDDQPAASVTNHPPGLDGARAVVSRRVRRLRLLLGSRFTQRHGRHTTRAIRRRGGDTSIRASGNSKCARWCAGSRRRASSSRERRVCEVGFGGGRVCRCLRQVRAHVIGLEANASAIDRVREDRRSVPSFARATRCRRGSARPSTCGSFRTAFEHIPNPGDVRGLDARPERQQCGNPASWLPRGDSLSRRLMGGSGCTSCQTISSTGRAQG